MKLLRQFCVLLCNRKEKIMQIRKPCKNKGLFRTKMIWKIKVRFRTTSGSSLRQDRGRQEAEPGTACAHLRSIAKKNCPDQLLIRRAVGERGKTCCTYLNLFRALRAAGADVKRGWRILGRVWQHGFPHVSAGWPANSRYTAHTQSVVGILPVLRLPRTSGAAAYAAPAAMIAKPIDNRDRYQSLPDSLLLRT